MSFPVEHSDSLIIPISTSQNIYFTWFGRVEKGFVGLVTGLIHTRQTSNAKVKVINLIKRTWFIYILETTRYYN